MEKLIFEQMGGTYHKQGNYFLPGLAVPEEDKQPIGVWCQRHLRHIRERALCASTHKARYAEKHIMQS